MNKQGLLLLSQQREHRSGSFASTEPIRSGNKSSRSKFVHQFRFQFDFHRWSHQSSKRLERTESRCNFFESSLSVKIGLNRVVTYKGKREIPGQKPPLPWSCRSQCVVRELRIAWFGESREKATRTALSQKTPMRDSDWSCIETNQKRFHSAKDKTFISHKTEPDSCIHLSASINLSKTHEFYGSYPAVTAHNSNIRYSDKVKHVTQDVSSKNYSFCRICGRSAVSG